MLVALPASDPDGDPLAVTLSGVPAGLTATPEGLGVRLRADAAGAYTFTYTVEDPDGLTASAQVHLDVTAPPTTTTTMPPATTTTAPPATTTTTVVATTTTVPR